MSWLRATTPAKRRRRHGFFYVFPVVQRHSRRNSSKNSSSSRQCPFYAITRRPNKQSVTRWSPWRDNSGLLSVIRRSVILQCNALLSTVSGTIPVVLAPSGLVSFAVWNMSLCSTFLDGFIYVAFVFLHFLLTYGSWRRFSCIRADSVSLLM